LFILSACEDTATPDDDGPICNVNQHVEDGICVDNNPIEDPPVVCDDYQHLVDDTCVDWTALERLNERIDLVMARYDDIAGLVTRTDVTLRIHRAEGNVPWAEATLFFETLYDEDRNYYYEWASDIQDDATDEVMSTQIDHHVIIDTEGDELRHWIGYEMALRLHHTEDKANYADYLMAQNPYITPFFPSITDSEPELLNDGRFIVDTLLSDLIGYNANASRILGSWGLGEFLQEAIPMVYQFDDTGYRTNITAEYSGIEAMIGDTAVVLYLEVEHKTTYEGTSNPPHPFSGTFNYQLPEHKEDVRYTNPLYADENDKEYFIADTGGWARYDITPGFYQFYVNGMPDSYDYTVYDGEGNVMDILEIFEQTTTDTIYVHIEPYEGESQQMTIGLEAVPITDLVVEYDLPVLSGTITGVNEGFSDRNRYYFAEAVPYDGYFIFDTRSVTDGFLMLIDGTLQICVMDGRDYCYALYEEGTTPKWYTLGGLEGEFTFSYTYHPLPTPTTDPAVMEDITTFDASNPIVITDPGVSVSLTVPAGQDVAINKDASGSGVLVYQMDLYTASGVLVEEDWNGSYLTLSPGDYIVTFSYSGDGYVFLVPQVLFHAR
jgi:hypothetical protein